MKAHKIILILMLACFAGACSQLFQSAQNLTISEDNRLFSDAERLFQRKAYSEALALYNQYLIRFPDGASAPLALMRQSEINMDQGKPLAARKLWQYLINRYPDCVFVPEARVGILSTLYDEKAYTEVIREGEILLKSITGYHPRVRMLIGDAYMATRSPVKAIESYSLAAQLAAPSEKEEIRKKIKSAVNTLPDSEIASLIGQSGFNPMLKGYLMYQSGLNHIRVEKYDEAVRTLSELVENLPNHEMVPEAKHLIQRFGKNREDQAAAAYPPTAASSPTQSLHKIGCLLPMTGPSGDYGNKALRGIELARSRAAAMGLQPADIVVKDSGTTPEQASQAVRELDESQVSAIIGPLTVAETAATEARNRGIPIIMLIQKSNTDTGNFVFRHFMTPEMQTEVISAYAASVGIRNFAILYPSEKYGTSFMGLFRQAVMARGGTIVETAAYAPNQTDFSAAIKKLSKSPFEALFIPDTAKKVGLILPQLAFNDLPNVALFGTHLWHSDSDLLIRMAEQYAQGAVIPEGFFAESRAPHVRDFVKNFQAAYKTKPEFMEAIAFDTAMMLFRILGKPGNHTRNEVRDELSRMQNFQGVTGPTSFDAKGEAHKKLYLLKVQGNAFVEIETP